MAIIIIAKTVEELERKQSRQVEAILLSQDMEGVPIVVVLNLSVQLMTIFVKEVDAVIHGADINKSIDFCPFCIECFTILSQYDKALSICTQHQFSLPNHTLRLHSR